MSLNLHVFRYCSVCYFVSPVYPEQYKNEDWEIIFSSGIVVSVFIACLCLTSTFVNNKYTKTRMVLNIFLSI